MATTYVTVPLGTTSAQLQAMIDAAAPDTVFQLEAGDYTFDSTVVISQSHISIVGAGVGQTTIHASTALGADPVIRVGHELHRPEIEATYQIAQPASVGDTSIEMQSGHGVQVGDFIYITQQNTSEFFDEIGDTSWRKDKDLRTILVEVTAVDGDTVTFDSPLTFDYDPAISDVQVRTILEGNELSGFTMEGAYGAADPNRYYNDEGAVQGATFIMVGGTSDMVITDIHLQDAASHGITFAGSTGVTVDNVSANGAHNKGGGGNGYSIWIRDTYDSSFTNLDITDVRHAVLFASYTSASGNYVHVSFTNRDINFHGGRDQNNTVVVDQMYRDEVEQHHMSTATYYNPPGGERWGAPTDPSTNPIYIREVQASNKDDLIASHWEGSIVYTYEANDTIITNDGNDFVDAGTSGDTVFASDGLDTIVGGSGTDSLALAGNHADYTITRFGAWLYLTHAGGVTLVTEVENFDFADGSYSEDVLFNQAALEANPVADPYADGVIIEGVLSTGEGGPDTVPGDGGDTSGGGGTDTTDGGGTDTTGGGGTDTTDGGGTDTTGGGGTDTTDGGGTDTTDGGGTDTTDGGGTDTTDGGGADTVPGSDVDWGDIDTTGWLVVNGESWWDRQSAGVDFVLGANVDGSEFTNEGDLSAVGNALDNNMLGNSGANRLEGHGGDDRIFARDGDDTLLGGDGNDLLEGAGGNDALFGGAGNDTVEGGADDDTMLASAGMDTLNGESGTDTAIFTGVLGSYTISESSGAFTITSGADQAYVINTEFFVFDGQNYAAADVMAAWTAAGGGTDTTDGGGTDTTDGGGTDTTDGGGTDTTDGGGTDTTDGGGTDTTDGGGTDTTDGGGTDTTDGGGTDTTDGGGTDTTDGGGTDTTDGGGTDTTDGGGTDTTDGGGTDTTDGGLPALLPSELQPIDTSGLPIFDGVPGDDTLRVEESFIMGAELDAGRVEEEAGQSTLIGNELDNYLRGNDFANRLEGLEGDDSVRAEDGNDTVLGGAGNDTLKGGSDDDLIWGGTGLDTLDGGNGSDRFVFLTGDQRAYIADADLDENDRILLGVDGITTVAEAMSFAQEAGSDVKFSFANGDELVVNNMELAEVEQALVILV